MSKIRHFGWGYYEYFEHCPFCGSVGVDFDSKTFRCPDCGAVVTFELPKEEDIDIVEDSSDAKRMINLWNQRKGEDITADDFCVLAQKADKELLTVYQNEVASEAWSYMYKAAKLGKFSCEIPKKYVSPEYYRNLKFDVEEKGDDYVISWKKDIKWDYD